LGLRKNTIFSKRPMFFPSNIWGPPKYQVLHLTSGSPATLNFSNSGTVPNQRRSKSLGWFPPLPSNSNNRWWWGGRMILILKRWCTNQHHPFFFTISPPFTIGFPIPPNLPWLHPILGFAPRYHRPHLGHGPVQQDLWWPPAVVLRNSPPGPRAQPVIAQWALASIFISTWVEAPDDVVFSPPQVCFLNPFPRKQWSHSWIAYQLRTSPDLTCRKWSTLGFYTHQPATQVVSAHSCNSWSMASLPSKLLELRRTSAAGTRSEGSWPMAT